MVQRIKIGSVLTVIGGVADTFSIIKTLPSISWQTLGKFPHSILDWVLVIMFILGTMSIIIGFSVLFRYSDDEIRQKQIIRSKRNQAIDLKYTEKQWKKARKEQKKNNNRNK